MTLAQYRVRLLMLALAVAALLLAASMAFAPHAHAQSCMGGFSSSVSGQDRADANHELKLEAPGVPPGQVKSDFAQQQVPNCP